MTQRRKLTRREFIQLSGLAVAGVVVASCKAPATEAPATAESAAPTVKPDEPSAPVSKFQEAPMLAELVAAGSLPPVDERLPLNPYVATVREMVGNYGGTIRRGFKGVSDRWGPTKFIDRCLVWLDEDLVMTPRIIESWEVSADAKTFTMKLRKGMKWSDGSDFTGAAFKWFYENQCKNTELNAAPPSKYSTMGEDGNRVLCEMEFPDDYTVVYIFAHPNPMFLYGALRDNNGFFTPEFMAQYHGELAEDKDALDAAVKEAGYGSWTEYFNDMNYWYLNKDRPQTYPWLADNSLAEELFYMKRNPYYFAVDPEGNQLPYLDTVTHRLFETTEVFNMWIVNGEIDFQNRHVGINNFTLFKENEAGGDYKVFLGTSAGHVAFQLNLSTKEPKLNEFFNDRNVRIAISYAMNRDEVNELIYDGLLTPRQYSPLKLSPNYYEKLSNAYIEYNPDKANQMLDDAGYDKRDAEGFRMWKDGSGPISFIMEGTAEPGSAGDDEAQLITKYMADVGIKATYKYFERSLYTEHYQNNEIEAAIWGGDRTVLPLAPGAPIFRGTMVDRPWAAGYGAWFNSNGTDPNGVEPPEGHFIWKIWEIWDQISVEPDPEQQNKLLEQIMDIWAEELPMIGLLGESPAPIIVKNGFRNYLPGQPIDDTTGDEHLLQTETYFWENPEEHSG